MELKIKLPRTSETLTKQVTFWDANGNGRCQGTIKANVITPVTIDESILDINDEKIHWKTLVIKSSNASIDLRKLKLIAYGPEVIGHDLKSEDGKQGVLRLEIDPSQTYPPSIQSLCTLEVSQDGQFCGARALPMRFTSRTVTQPEPVYFRLVGKEYQAQVRVWSFPLATELSKKNEFVVATLDSAKKIEGRFETTIEPAAGKGPTCTVTFRYMAPKFGNTVNTEQLRLKCGGWERVIASKWE